MCHFCFCGCSRWRILTMGHFCGCIRCWILTVGHFGCCFSCRNLTVDYLCGCTLPNFNGGPLMWLYSLLNLNGRPRLLPRQRCQIPRRKHRNVKPHYLWKFGIFWVLLVQLRLVYVGRKVGSPADPSPLPPLIKGWPAKTNTEFWKPDTELYYGLGADKKNN